MSVDRNPIQSQPHHFSWWRGIRAQIQISEIRCGHSEGRVFTVMHYIYEPVLCFVWGGGGRSPGDWSFSADVSELSIRSIFIGVQLYAYEDGTHRKFRNVGTKSSDAGRLPRKTQHGIQHTEKVWNQDIWTCFTAWFTIWVTFHLPTGLSRTSVDSEKSPHVRGRNNSIAQLQ